MRMVLFDLGDTLEDSGRLRTGAQETLTALTGESVMLGLLSDFDMPADPSDTVEIADIRERYLAILDDVGIRTFFQPQDRRVTLSTEVGVLKPDPATFRTAIAKADPTLAFDDVLFVTENTRHVRAARTLGLLAVRVRTPDEPPGTPADVTPGEVPDEVAELSDIVAVVRGLLAGAPPSDNTHRHVGGCRTGRSRDQRTAVLSPSRAELVAPSDPDVLARLDTLSRDDFVADLETLADHPTRRSDSAGLDVTATWAENVLADAGYAVSTKPVPLGGGKCRNIIGDRPGTGPEPRDVVLVTAHLDSINLSGAAEAAPGADDNASGSAGLLALARALSANSAALDLRMILFGGEEEGLFGSLRYVAALSTEERSRTRAVLNMDMIGGRNTAEPGVLLEGAAVSQEMLDGLAAAAATYTDLVVSISHNPYNSDHVPFIEAGMPAVLTIEADDSANTRPHTADDVVAAVDPDLAMQILRMNLAYLIETLGEV